MLGVTLPVEYATQPDPSGRWRRSGSHPASRISTPTGVRTATNSAESSTGVLTQPRRWENRHHSPLGPHSSAGRTSAGTIRITATAPVAVAAVVRPR